MPNQHKPLRKFSLLGLTLHFWYYLFSTRGHNSIVTWVLLPPRSEWQTHWVEYEGSLWYGPIWAWVHPLSAAYYWHWWQALPTRVSSIKRLRKKWGLKSTHQQQHTSESIASSIQTIRKSYPSWGADTIWKQLRIEFGIWAPRWFLCTICCKIFNSKLIQRGRHGVLKKDWARHCQGPSSSALQVQAFPCSGCQQCVGPWSTW